MGLLINPISYRLGSFCLNNSIWGVSKLKKMHSIFFHKDLQIYQFLFFYYSVFRKIKVRLDENKIKRRKKKKNNRKDKNIITLNGIKYKILNTNGYIFFYFKEKNIFEGTNLRILKYKTKYSFLSDVYVIRYDSIINIKIILYDLNEELFFNKLKGESFGLRNNFEYLMKKRNKKRLKKLALNIKKIKKNNISIEKNIEDFRKDDPEDEDKLDDIIVLKEDWEEDVKYEPKFMTDFMEKLYNFNYLKLYKKKKKMIKKENFSLLFFKLIEKKKVYKIEKKKKFLINLKKKNNINYYFNFFNNNIIYKIKDEKNSYVKLDNLKNSIRKKKIYIKKNDIGKGRMKKSLLFMYYFLFELYGDHFKFFYFFNTFYNKNIYNNIFSNNYIFDYYYLINNNILKEDLIEKFEEKEFIKFSDTFKQKIIMKRLKRNIRQYTEYIETMKKIRIYERELFFSDAKKKKNVFEEMFEEKIGEYTRGLGNMRNLSYKLNMEYEMFNERLVFTKLFFKEFKYENIFYKNKDLIIDKSRDVLKFWKGVLKSYREKYKLLGLDKFLGGITGKKFKERKIKFLYLKRFKYISIIKRKYLFELEDLYDYRKYLKNYLFENTYKNLKKFKFNGFFNYIELKKKRKKKFFDKRKKNFFNKYIFNDFNYNSKKMDSLSYKIHYIFEDINIYDVDKLEINFSKKMKIYYFKILCKIFEGMFIKNYILKFNKGYNIFINYYQLMVPSAYVLGIHIKKYLEIGKHYTLNRVIYPLIKNIVKHYPDIKSIQICCKGRFTKRQRASYLWYTNFGAVSYSTKSVIMDFSKTSVFLKYGVGGVRLWLVLKDRSTLNYSNGFF